MVIYLIEEDPYSGLLAHLALVANAHLHLRAKAKQLPLICNASPALACAGAAIASRPKAPATTVPVRVNHFRFTLFPPQDLVDRAVPVFTDFDRYFRSVIRGVLRQYLGEEITEERITALVGMYIYLMNGLLSIDKFVSEEQLADRVEISFALFWELVEKNPSSG
jgi:hypothetical protein